MLQPGKMKEVGWREEVESDLQVLGVRRWRELVIDWDKWRGYFSTGQIPQRAIAPTEEEEESSYIKSYPIKQI